MLFCTLVGIKRTDDIFSYLYFFCQILTTLDLYQFDKCHGRVINSIIKTRLDHIRMRELAGQ